MSRFVFLTSGDLSSAAYFRHVNLVNQLALSGEKVTFSATNTPENRAFSAGFLNKNVTWYWYSSTKLLGALEVRSFLAKSNFEYVVQLNSNLRSLINLAFIKKRIVLEIDEPSFLRDDGIWSNFLNKFLFSWLSRKAFKVIVCAKELLKYYPSAVYIHHGNYADVKEIQLNHNPFETDNYFVYLGNFFPLWDHEKILYGLRNSKQRGFTPKVILIGSGPDLESSKEFCRDHGLDNVHFTGYLSQHDWLPILRGARALLFPMADTQLNRCRCPSKIFAYFAAKRPVIAHAVGEIVTLLPDSKFIDPDVDIIEALEAAHRPDFEVYEHNQCLKTDLSYESMAAKWLGAIAFDIRFEESK